MKTANRLTLLTVVLLIVVFVLQAGIPASVGPVDQTVTTSFTHLSGPSGASAAGHWSAVGATVFSRSFPGTYAVNTLISNQSTALLDVQFLNLSNELVLFNAAAKTSKIIQKVVPGGVNTSLISAVSAGGAFYLAWENITTGTEFWQKVTLAGKITEPNLPSGVGTNLLWTFDYGNGTSLFASYSRVLVEINASSLKVVANDTKSIPPSVSIASVLPLGNRLYLGGTREVTPGSSTIYFGYLNLTSGKVTTVTKTLKTYPANLTGAFYGLLAHGSKVYLGGALEVVTLSPYQIQTVGGYFYSYTPATSTFKNLSSILPVKSWGVWALEPWGRTIGLSLSGYTANLTTGLTLAGGIYTLSGTSLVNHTSAFPKGFLAYIYGVTAESNGWYFSGGFNTIAGDGEAVAITT